ncbi:MAG TPA: nuclear transport factor 2 family protein [Vicinamibacterales bacterium]|nr:nuclear transport factor 2 family protein [Vicinamibacterales bacterium]
MLKRLGLLVIALVSVSSPHVIASQAGKSGDAEVVSVVQQLADAQRTFDQAALERLLAPDYIEVSPVGDVDDRAKVIGFYSAEAKTKAPPVSSIAIDETTVRIYGDHAVVIARQTMNISAGGTNRPVVMRTTSHLRKIGGVWKISSMQYTGVRSPNV